MAKVLRLLRWTNICMQSLHSAIKMGSALRWMVRDMPHCSLYNEVTASRAYGNQGVLCQKQVSRAGTSNYIPLILWDVITCACPWYLILLHNTTHTQKSIWIVRAGIKQHHRLDEEDRTILRSILLYMKFRYWFKEWWPKSTQWTCTKYRFACANFGQLHIYLSWP